MATSKSKAVNFRQSKTYKRLVKLIAKSYMNKQRLNIAECPISIHLTFVFTSPNSYTKKKLKPIEDGSLVYQKKPDLDNLAKSILNALNETIYKDDSQIVELNVKKRYGDTDHVLIAIDKL
ncbi:RusA family crossover junction endodeoxyribonuclease [Salinicoccus sp. CNSTN-B1]